MVPPQAGGRRLWRAIGHSNRAPLSTALAITMILAAVLGQSSLATAQQSTPQTQDPAFFPATGYRINSPAILDYFQHRGGVRTFGYPVSGEFPMLGQRVQLFQRALLQLDSDGNVQPANILSADMLPITHIDGLSLPAEDPDMVATAPSADSPDFTGEALGYINVYVPDTWNGLPVNFQQTFLNTVTCADAFGSDDCDTSTLPELDLQMWGLPTSLPTTDPMNADFVYQRFQRGIMHFSRASGATQGLLLGDWLKRVMVGVDLSPDLNPEVRQSRYFAQYAPSRPLALDRPADLPDTSLAQAFRADSLTAAGQGVAQAEPTLPTNVAQTATAVALTSTAVVATQAALAGQQNLLTSTALALTATATTSNANVQLTPTGTPVGVVSNIPVVDVGCLGDEQMWFVPRKPNVGVHVQISVTSQRHHDARSMALGGPVDPGPVVEHQGPLGFIWTWTVVPTVEDFYQWTFFADGLRPCITSGFNTFASLGATPTPTITPVATNTPGTATPTPTNTPVAAPIIRDISNKNNLTCGQTVNITGSNFGTPPSSFGTNVTLINGAQTFLLTQVGTGSSASLLVTMPGTGSSINASQPTSIIVSNSGGDSAAFPVQFAAASANGCSSGGNSPSTSPGVTSPSPAPAVP